MRLCVVKLGGSLFDMPELFAKLRVWLARQSAFVTLLVAGGGEAVDAIRHDQRQKGLDDAEAHWLSIRAMYRQAETLRAALDEAEGPATAANVQRIASVTQDAESKAGRRLMILDPWRFMHDEDPLLSPTPLPESWDVTSDSIAARAAELLAADELVLLKSGLPSPGASIEEMAAAGFVDRFFAQAVGKLAHVRIVNLRDGRMPEITLTRSA